MKQTHVSHKSEQPEVFIHDAMQYLYKPICKFMYLNVERTPVD